MSDYVSGTLTGVLGCFVFLGLLAAWGDWVEAQDAADLERYRKPKK